MDIDERVYTVLKGAMPERVPLLIYSNHLPRGNFERNMRNMNLGLDVRCRVCRAYKPNVRTETRTIGDDLYTTYITPLGEVYSKRRINMRFQLPGGTWLVEHPIKNQEDIGVVKYMIEDTVYEPCYEDYFQLEESLEGDGVITVGADYTPLMKTITGLMGFKNFAVMYRRNAEAIEELLKVLDRKYEEMYKIIAESPARIVRIGDNIDGVMISPKLFEKYCLPYYNKYAQILQESGKIVISHMDGRLKTLKDLIAMTKLDAIEAFTPPPMGNLEIGEAREAWKDKVLWMNYPEEIFLRTTEQIRAYTSRLLEEMAPGAGYIVGITEDIHPEHLRKGLQTLTETLYEYGKLPLAI